MLEPLSLVAAGVGVMAFSETMSEVAQLIRSRGRDDG